MAAKVYLLGAGPGDPGLITQRALQRLKEADVVLYDALVHPDLLAHCREDAEKVFVGKRAGKASARQARINDRMKEEAESGRVVARLKGGDPYLFGRGSEEAEFLSAAGIPFEVVPGVPSPVVAAAYAGISLTHRDLSSSVAYITATESAEKDRTSHDWAKLATATQTLVIFMGLRKLRGLMKLLVDNGRPPDTPACVIQSASLPSQRTVVGTVSTIADLAEKAELGMPSLTIVGPVVSLREELRWFDRLPLFGKRVLVTRPSGQAAVLSERLRNEGAAPVEAPTIRIAPPEDPAPLAKAVKDLATYQWVLFTSRNGVTRFFAEIARQGGDARRLGGARVVAIGPGTASALADAGITADQVPKEHVGEEVARIVLQAHDGDLSGVRVLLPRAKVAREALPETLRDAGAEVDVVAAYRNVPPAGDEAERIRRLLGEGEVDVVTFTASSTVQNLCEVLGDDAGALLAPLTLASIGPITTATAERLGLSIAVTASEYTNAGLVDALRDHFAGSP
jgi:uroporphyrinogen III methyltransferase/synthase